MSVLVLGGDNIEPIKQTLYSYGAKEVLHWDGRNLKNGRKKDKAIPSKVNIVLMLTNFLNHNAMKFYKKEAKRKGVQIIFAKRHIENVKKEFNRLLGHKCCGDCGKCNKFQ